MIKSPHLESSLILRRETNINSTPIHRKNLEYGERISKYVQDMHYKRYIRTSADYESATLRPKVSQPLIYTNIQLLNLHYVPSYKRRSIQFKIIPDPKNKTKKNKIRKQHSVPLQLQKHIAPLAQETRRRAGVRKGDDKLIPTKIQVIQVNLNKAHGAQVELLNKINKLKSYITFVTEPYCYKKTLSIPPKNSHVLPKIGRNTPELLSSLVKTL